MVFANFFRAVSHMAHRLGRPFRRTLAARRSQSKAVWRRRLDLELLEDRCLLATWVPIGPDPQFVPKSVAATLPNENVSGRVSALAITPDYDGAGHPAMLLGAASGGIWRSTDFMSTPVWSPTTDNIGLPVNATKGYGAGALAIGAIAVDPNHPRTIYAGTGEAKNWKNWKNWCQFIFS